LGLPRAARVKAIEVSIQTDDTTAHGERRAAEAEISHHVPCSGITGKPKGILRGQSLFKHGTRLGIINGLAGVI